MEKWVGALVSAMLVACLMLSGCQNQSAVVTDLSSKVHLNSNGLVKFVNASMTRTLDKSKNVQSVKVSWLFENIAGRTINLRIKVQFFDATGHQMYNETKTFENMLAGFKETDYSPFNSVTYAGADAGKVDNVLITTTEMT